MVLPSIGSFFDNLKERTTNPFLGTLIVVWSVKNWRLLYSLLYFDGKLTLDQRLAKISEHFKDQSFIRNMLISVAITLVVLIATYLMLALSRLLTDLYDNVILPLSSKITDKSSVVLKSEYLLLKEENRQLEIRLEEERLAKIAAQKERDAVDKTLSDINRTQTVENVKTEELNGADENKRARNLSSMYSVTGSAIKSSHMPTVKKKFFEYISKNKVRQYGGGFEDDGEFNLRLLIDEPNDYLNLIKDLTTDPDIQMRGYSSTGGIDGNEK